jgi:hypothetical protein
MAYASAQRRPRAADAVLFVGRPASGGVLERDERGDMTGVRATLPVVASPVRFRSKSCELP